MQKEFNVVGARLPMLDAAQKAKGTAQFTDDLILPGMLYGKIVRSPVAHAKILNIDTLRSFGSQKRRGSSDP
jgi:4-hydroxybenzoyl-CoA reductase subunit alpha